MPDKEAIRAEMESTRADYQALLRSLSLEGWSKRSGNPEMTVKQLMWHTAWAVGWMASSVDAVKSGTSLRPPGFLIEPGRRLAMRWLARNATPERAAQKYDDGHTALLARLDAATDDDWHLQAVRFGETRTVEWYFQHVRDHFEEHARDVRAAISTKVQK